MHGDVEQPTDGKAARRRAVHRSVAWRTRIHRQAHLPRMDAYGIEGMMACARLRQGRNARRTRKDVEGFGTRRTTDAARDERRAKRREASPRINSCAWKRASKANGFLRRPGCASHVSEGVLHAIAEVKELSCPSGLAMERRRRWKLLMVLW
mmetsp:Transcript_795/g.3133  ORF Transcript_795/g.3133 Transcript_795/m.3133 type:complete len:152 (-) Transcript_795:454-909(-)